MTTNTKLKVWHIPQIPMKPFEREVDSLDKAALLLYVLAKYDSYELSHGLKGDYSNVAGLVFFDEDEKEWIDWYEEDSGDDIDTWSRHNWFPPKGIGVGLFVYLLDILKDYDQFQYDNRVKGRASSSYEFLKALFDLSNLGAAR